jgi:hypothetical protein
VWDAERIADGYIALIERGYVVMPEGTRRELARRLEALRREIQRLRPLLEKHAVSKPARR